MLTKFSVCNYMGFSKKITWDLSHPRDYGFNTHLIKDGVVKNGIIYGINGSGKSSLGLAVFDIVRLVDQYPVDYRKTIYQGAVDKPMEFEYSFLFDGTEKVDYAYGKNNQGSLVSETLSHNGQEIFFRDGANLRLSDEFPVDAGMQEKLAVSSNAVSILKFLVGTFPLSKDHYLQKLMEFVGSMLWFRCLDERNYIGIDSGGVYLEDYFIKHDYLEDFAKFLKEESGQVFDFSPTEPNQKHILCRIGDNAVPLQAIMSTGTKSLELLFYWFKRMNEVNVKFVFIDEFDAFYHFDLSINICRTLFKEDFQVFLSSHTTMLLNNDFLRPDCAFYLKEHKIDALSELTNRGELRQGHNIEKMYRAGSFDLK